jgi:FMN phosphatase YigB (HAD superfamily)
MKLVIFDLDDTLLNSKEVFWKEIGRLSSRT